MNKVLQAIEVRYSDLAEKPCCLSCGGAVNHAKVRAGETAVDLGSGKGNDVIRMAELAGPEGKAYGIDISEGMLHKAESTAQRLGVTNAFFLKGELEALPLEDGCADVLISNCVLNHAQDKSLVWKEIYRVLKPGGRFVVSDIYSLEAVPEQYRNDPVAVSECWAGSVTREEYLAQVSGAGFRHLTILEESEPYLKVKVDVCSWTISAIKE